MTDPIDFTTWTTAQLRAGAAFADRSPNGPALLAELKRREEEGTLDDGSEQRVADLIASARPKRRRRR